MTYMDDDTMLQLAKSVTYVTRRLQECFHAIQVKADLLNISCAPAKIVIIHFLPHSSNLSSPSEVIFVGPSKQLVQPKKQFKTLGVVVDRRLTFGIQALASAASLKNATMALKNLLRIKSTTMATAYHFALQTVIPAGLRGSEISGQELTRS